MSWDARTLPALPEKLAARAAFLRPPRLWPGARVLCLYGGNEAHLTRWYRAQGAVVVAVDRDGQADVTADVPRWLRAQPPTRWDVVDIDPFGSSLPTLATFLAAGHRAPVLCLTEGTLAHVRLRRRINLYRHYGLLPDRPVRPARWQYEHFAALVLCGLVRQLNAIGWAIRDFACQPNCWRMGLYVHVECGDAAGA